MEAYVSKEFLNHLDDIWDSAKNDILSPRITNLQALLSLILALPVKSDISKEDVEQIITEKKGSTILKSIQEIFASINIRDNKKFLVGASLSEIENYSAYYFLDSKSDKETDLGIVVKDKEFDGSSFYNNCTVTDLAIPEKGGWDFLKENIAPSNAMLIIDRYIFGGPIELKLKNLIDFIILHKKNIKIPFHLSLIFSSDLKSSKQPPLSEELISKSFEKILSLGNIECEFVIENRDPYHDRLVFTNYTSGNIGLPFTDGPTRFNQNFLGYEMNSERVKKNYSQYKRDLKYWKSIINKAPVKIGVHKVKWKSSDFENRIFSVL